MDTPSGLTDADPTANFVGRHSDRFEPLPDEALARWSKFPSWEEIYFPTLVGIQMSEVKRDYCRLVLPFRQELTQPAGIVHGGVTATLIDTVVVPAIGAAYEEGTLFATITMNVEYRSAVKPGETMVAEGWVTQRGKSVVFTQAEVWAADRLVATGTCIYKVSPPRS